MMDSGAMYALTQLQAEVERVQREMALLHASYLSLRRVAGVFYDAAVADTNTERHRARRHLRGLN